MPYIESTVRILLKKWDGLCEKGLKNGSEDGREYIESLDWFNALAFDVIGDLAFGQSFGMLERDAADLVAITQEDGTIIYSAAVKILNERGEFSVGHSSFLKTNWTALLTGSAPIGDTRRFTSLGPTLYEIYGSLVCSRFEIGTKSRWCKHAAFHLGSALLVNKLRVIDRRKSS